MSNADCVEVVCSVRAIDAEEGDRVQLLRREEIPCHPFVEVTQLRYRIAKFSWLAGIEMVANVGVVGAKEGNRIRPVSTCALDDCLLLGQSTLHPRLPSLAYRSSGRIRHGRKPNSEDRSEPEQGRGLVSHSLKLQSTRVGSTGWSFQREELLAYIRLRLS